MQSPIILLPSASPCQPGNWACSPAWHKANSSGDLSCLLLLVSGAVPAGSGALALWGRWAVQAPGSLVVPAAFPAVLDKLFPLVQHFSSLFSLSPPTPSNAAGRELPFGRKKKDQLFPFSEPLNLIRLILHLPQRHTKKINVTSSHRRRPLGPVGVSNYFHYWATSRMRIKDFNYWPYSGGKWQEDGYLATSRGQHGILIAAFGREYKKGCQEQINSERGALQQPPEPQGSVMKSAPRVHGTSGDARFWATCTSASPKIEQLSIRRHLCAQNFPFHSPRFNPS